MLGPEVHAPLDVALFELVAIGNNFLEDLDALGVGEALRWCVSNVHNKCSHHRTDREERRIGARMTFAVLFST